MTKKFISLETESRKVLGRKVKRLRKQGIIPANVFGKKIPSQSIQVSQSEFSKVFRQAGVTTIIDLIVKGEKTSKSVLISKVQNDPVTNLLLHIDFHQVDLKEKVTASIPLGTTGESPAVKDKGGVLLLAINEVEVEALPTDLPDHLEVDISHLNEIGESVLVKDIKIDREKVKLELDDQTTIAVIQEKEAKEEQVIVKEEPEEGKETISDQEAAKDEQAEEKSSDKGQKSAKEETTKGQGPEPASTEPVERAKGKKS